MGGQIRLERVAHVRRGRWRRVELLPHQSRGCWVEVGVLADGRWYVDVVQPNGDDCRTWPDERAAWRAARAQIAALGGDWVQVPHDPTGDARQRARQAAGG